MIGLALERIVSLPSTTSRVSVHEWPVSGAGVAAWEPFGWVARTITHTTSATATVGASCPRGEEQGHGGGDPESHGSLQIPRGLKPSPAGFGWSPPVRTQELASQADALASIGRIPTR